MISRFSFPTNIMFGPGAVRELGSLAAGLGATRALLVTDRGVIAAGLTERVQHSLTGSRLAMSVYDGVLPNPTEENVEEGIARYRSEHCDIIVALGGGSALDAGKAIRLRTSHSLPLEDYDDNLNGGEKIGSPMPPLIAIPTTAGTGSEVGRSTVIICRSNQRKTVIFSPALMPTYAVCDPELTLGLSPRLTAATGMDAFTHNLEAYLSTPFHPMADAIALGGIRLCAKSLRRAFDDGADLEARGDMMMAAVMGATAFQKGLGVTHSLSHPLSSMAGMHHGTANSVLLPGVLEYNQPVCQARFADVGVVLGIAPESLPDWVRELNRSLAIPKQLRDYGITSEMIPALVEKAMEDGCYHLNPRPVTREDMRKLYEAAS